MLPLLLAACTPDLDARAHVAAPAPAPVHVPTWPDDPGALHPPPIDVPPDHRPSTVFLVAGHGARDNEGNLGAWCTREQDFTLRTTDALAHLLASTGQFGVVRARTGEQRPSYAARLRHLARSGASLLIELHSDSRAHSVVQNGTSAAGEPCWRDDSEPGFTVLVHDRGEADLVTRRLALARALALALADTGFPPWVGDYNGLYEADAVPGVWRDRRNLYMLRQPAVPSVIVETHNARDGRETLRWDEPATRDAFGRAVVTALLRYERSVRGQ
ncbi:MAG: N-acetylmuramoyl-L-alanine amidase [Myxococcota bacterium]